jgi:hypothetical protein
MRLSLSWTMFKLHACLVKTALFARAIPSLRFEIS